MADEDKADEDKAGEAAKPGEVPERFRDGSVVSFGGKVVTDTEADFYGGDSLKGTYPDDDPARAKRRAAAAQMPEPPEIADDDDGDAGDEGDDS